MKSPATLFAYQSMTRPPRHAHRLPTRKPKRQPTPRTDWAGVVRWFFFIR